MNDSLEIFLDVNSVLKYFAVNLLTGSWDSYWFLMNNYYLYHNPSEDTFYLIPYDYDNAFGIDWFNIDWASIDPYEYALIDTTRRPLAERLINNPVYRNLYTHFIQSILMLPVYHQEFTFTAWKFPQIHQKMPLHLFRQEK